MKDAVEMAYRIGLQNAAAVAEQRINHPAHYTAGEIECIDAIASAVTGLSGMEAYCTGNALKYIWRWKWKNGAEDIRKAIWYLERMEREIRKEERT